MMDTLIDALPVSRQILLYSATFPITVKDFMVRFFLVQSSSTEMFIGTCRAVLWEF